LHEANVDNTLLHTTLLHQISYHTLASENICHIAIGTV